MKDISIKHFLLGNDQDLTLMGGMNVLESEEMALVVAEKFKEAFVEKYGIKREELKKGIVDKVYNQKEKVEK